MCTYIIIAPSSAPSITAVNYECTTGIMVTWTHDTADADGYVVYYNSHAKVVAGGDIKEALLDELQLIPATAYNITVRAYQDILGPASTLVVLTTGTRLLGPGKLDSTTCSMHIG